MVTRTEEIEILAVAIEWHTVWPQDVIFDRVSADLLASWCRTAAKTIVHDQETEPLPA